MKRRDFFRRGAEKIATAAVDVIDAKVQRRAQRWFRPPYAKPELDLLLACERCDKCIEACPHQVLFALPARLGLEVAQTPAMDLVNKGCHLCSDWPCVVACEHDALAFVDYLITDPNDEDKVELLPPKIGGAQIDKQHCLPYNGPACGACAGICPQTDCLTFIAEKPYINSDSCIGCGLCREVCIAQPKAITLLPYAVIATPDG